MCKYFKTLIFIFFFLFNFSNANAEEKIVFVDVDYIYSNSTIGSDINKKLKLDRKKINDELANFQKKINSQIKDLETKRNILSKDDYSSKRVDIDKSVGNFNLEIKQKREKILIYENKARTSFLTELNKILNQYVENNSIQLIINKRNIVIGKKSLDVTDNILKMFDKNIKSIKIN